MTGSLFGISVDPLLQFLIGLRKILGPTCVLKICVQLVREEPKGTLLTLLWFRLDAGNVEKDRDPGVKSVEFYPAKADVIRFFRNAHFLTKGYS
ncbi:hypothetical protein ABEI05_24085 [Erwinia billingiae]|jgi:hypothetical protein|uniref:hypothetical protein n=1 Tax=Erwinia billingiae TaxID=182337 RepID=UPI000B298D14|nr:hypothetical protein [Erwinia billingiae]